MVRRKSRSELELAEIKLQSLRERRDAANAEAAAARQERDLLHARRKELQARVRELRDRRNEFAGEARAHRDVRNRLQSEAKGLIELKRESRGRVWASVAADLERLRSEALTLEMRQQTETLTLTEENELLDELKSTMRRVRELEGLKVEQDGAVAEIRELDAAIDERFRLAEEEHQLAVSLAAKADALHAEIQELAPQIATTGAEAGKKHEEFLAHRAKADELHASALGMREHVIAIRGEARAEQHEARRAIKDQSLAVQRALLDTRKLDDAAERAVQTILRGGRVEIKG